jgi:hypothetical protein
MWATSRAATTLAPAVTLKIFAVMTRNRRSGAIPARVGQHRMEGGFDFKVSALPRPSEMRETKPRLSGVTPPRQIARLQLVVQIELLQETLSSAQLSSVHGSLRRYRRTSARLCANRSDASCTKGEADFDRQPPTVGSESRPGETEERRVKWFTQEDASSRLTAKIETDNRSTNSSSVASSGTRPAWARCGRSLRRGRAPASSGFVAFGRE